MKAGRDPFRLGPFIASALIVVAFASTAMGQVSARGHRIEDPLEAAEPFLPPEPADAIASTVLTPVPGSATIVPALTLDLLADGRRSLRGVFISQEGQEEELVFFRIDPISGTYQTFRSQDLGEVGARELARFRQHAEDNLTLIECDCEEDPCEGAWTASVTTYDPIFLPLTETTGSANWHYVDVTDVCKLISGGSPSCWAANPSALGTHWFNSSCFGFNANPFGVDYNAGGFYFNWDFGLNTLRTDVSQSVRIELRHSIGVITSFAHADSGEFSALIYGSFFQSGFNTCFF